jgi:hypothetical protein
MLRTSSNGRLGWIRQVPIDVALSRIDRARIATPHRDDDVGRPDHFIGQWFGALFAQIEAHLVHDLADVVVDLVCRTTASGANVDLAVGVMVEKSRETGSHRTPFFLQTRLSFMT